MIHSLHRFKRTPHRHQVVLCLQVIPVCVGVLVGCGQPAGVVSTASSNGGQPGSRQEIDEVEGKKRSEKDEQENDIARPPQAEMGVVVSNPGDADNPRELLQQIEAQYNIRITVEGRTDESFYEGGAISGHPVQDEQLAQIVPILADELNVYSRELFEAMYLRQILLAADLKHHGKPVGGACTLATIYLDAGLSSPFANRAIHHELFHMIDRRGRRRQSDIDWARLNPPEFEYTQVVPTKGPWTLYSSKAGFLTEYSTSSVSEDKAETYALMIKFPELIRARVLRDDIVAAKVAHIRTRASTICEAVDDQFWNRVETRHESSNVAHASSLKVYLASETSGIDFGSGDGIAINRSVFQELATVTNHYELESLFRVSAERGEQPRHELKLDAKESRLILVTLGCKVSSLSIATPLITEISSGRNISLPFYLDVAVDGSNVYLQLRQGL